MLEQLLKDTKEVVNQGWIQHRFRDNAGGHCLLGAMYKAHDMQKYPHPSPELAFSAEIILAKAIARKTKKKYESSVASFNDKKSTTKEKVLEVLDIAIDIARKSVKNGA